MSKSKLSSVYIAIDDIESIHKRLVKSDCKYVNKTIEKMPWGERLFYANDPFGDTICFVDEKTIFTGR